MAEYTQPGRLHMAYSFELLSNDSSPQHIRATVEKLRQRAPESWPCWTISNHDVERVVSRWGRSNRRAHLATQLTALVCALRGSVCVFQGEELGLGEAELPYEALRDPYGIAFWPTFKGRDGCRTPMPWDASERGGFSSGKPWLPVPAQHLRAVGGGAGARHHVGAARLPPPAAMAPPAGAADHRATSNSSRRTDSVLAFRALRCAGRDAGGLQSLAGARAASLPRITVGRAIGGHGLPEGTPCERVP